MSRLHPIPRPTLNTKTTPHAPGLDGRQGISVQTPSQPGLYLPTGPCSYRQEIARLRRAQFRCV